MKVQGIVWLKEILFNYITIEAANGEMFRTPISQGLPSSGSFDADKDPTTIALKLVLTSPIPIIAGRGLEEHHISERSVQRLPRKIQEALLRLQGNSVFSLAGAMKKGDAEGWYWIMLYVPVKGELQNFAGFLRSVIKKLREPIPVFLPFNFEGKSYEVKWEPGTKPPEAIKLPEGKCVVASWLISGRSTRPQINMVSNFQQYPGLASAELAREVTMTSKELADALAAEIIGQDEYDEICAMPFDEALGYAFTLIIEAGYEDPEAYLKEKGILQ